MLNICSRSVQNWEQSTKEEYVTESNENPKQVGLQTKLPVKETHTGPNQTLPEINKLLL